MLLEGLGESRDWLGKLSLTFPHRELMSLYRGRVQTRKTPVDGEQGEVEGKERHQISS